MTTPFEQALELTVFDARVEGGLKLSLIEGDAGGTTFAGISRVYWPQWVGWILLDRGDAPESPAVIQAVKDFYRINFWLAIKGDLLPERLAFQVFDMAVNSDPKDAVRCLQRALGVKVDGDLGPVTLAAVKPYGDREASVRFNIARARHYARCKPLQPGWFNRLALMLERSIA